ncbi:MAG: DUF222 domain-containing protein [Candidatus Nanopelagicaceae bacterium]
MFQKIGSTSADVAIADVASTDVASTAPNRLRAIQVIPSAPSLIGDPILDSDDAERSPEIADLLKSNPGPEAMQRLLQLDKSTLTPADRIDFLTCWQRQSSWVAAQEQEAMLYVSGTQYLEKAGEFDVDCEERESVATALRISPATSQNKIDVARTLFNHLPQTISALNSGEISVQHAQVIAQETASAVRAGLDQYAIAEIEKIALAHAEFHTPNQVANKVRTTFAKLAPDLFQKEFDDNRAARQVRFYKEPNGIGTILATLKIEDAQLVDQVINDYSEKLLEEHRQAMLNLVKFSRGHICLKNCGADSRCAHPCSDGCKDECLALNSQDAAALAALERANLINSDFERDMRRADAFVFAMRAADAALKASGSIITKHNRRPTINVTIDLPTILGLADNPGQLAGYGPIPAAIAREIASDGRWKRFITDPIKGTLLDYGRETYEPPQDLQDFLIARDRTCRFPGCRQPAHLGDLDHVVPWNEGGTTSPDNLGALCRRHHNLKTHSDWQLINQEDGACTWISPSGHKYYVPPRPILDSI